MYKGKHGNTDRGRAPRRPRGKRSLTLALALVLVLGAAIGGTVAYLTTSTTGITNTFTPTSVDTEIEESFESNAKKSITVQNTGTTAAYIRVALVGNNVTTVEGTEYVTGGFVVSVHTGDGWSQSSDGYYYYTTPVQPGESTGDLLKSLLALKEGQSVTILADAIQAEPTSVVTDVWDSGVSSVASDGTLTIITGTN